jgi:formylmethanofuran dehydrogenase subunit E
MGLIACERLGKDPFDMRAVVGCVPEPPRSCTVDGVQYASGCTMGKANIGIEGDGDKVWGTFRSSAGKVTIRLKDDFLKRMEAELSGKPEKAMIDYAFGIMDTAPDQLFEVSE